MSEMLPEREELQRPELDFERPDDMFTCAQDMQAWVYARVNDETYQKRALSERARELNDFSQQLRESTGNALPVVVYAHTTYTDSTRVDQLTSDEQFLHYREFTGTLGDFFVSNHGGNHELFVNIGRGCATENRIGAVVTPCTTVRVIDATIRFGESAQEPSVAVENELQTYFHAIDASVDQLPRDPERLQLSVSIRRLEQYLMQHKPLSYDHDFFMGALRLLHDITGSNAARLDTLHAQLIDIVSLVSQLPKNAHAYADAYVVDTSTRYVGSRSRIVQQPQQFRDVAPQVIVTGESLSFTPAIGFIENETGQRIVVPYRELILIEPTE